MKKLLSVIFLFCMMLSMVSCKGESKTESQESSAMSQESEVESQDAEPMEDVSQNSSGFADIETVEKFGDILGITQEERLEDYEFLWNTLKDSYLFWGIIEREGIDIDGIYEEYLSFIEENQNDADFYVGINSTLFSLGQSGHLGIIKPDYYGYFKNVYKGIPNRTQWYETLNNEVSKKNYPKMAQLIKFLGDDEMQSTAGGGNPDKNVTAFIIPGGEAAYVRINSFAGEIYEKDKEILFDFYDTIGDCQNLIIDITSNDGGAEMYWMDLIVAPHIDAPLSNDNYALLSMSENNKPYIKQGFSDVELHPIANLPEMPKLNDTDKEWATHFYVSNRTVEPSDYRSPFKGEVTVLTSENVYSSAEAFAIFCKDTAFAKLAGFSTGGDGIGIDPAFVVLPNSGIIVRYSMSFGLNKDGRSNEEYGTAPDYISDKNESPLATALKVIENGE